MNGSHIMINDVGPHAHFGAFENKANKIRENSRVFFYTAETWNRIVSYRIAWGELIDKGMKPNDLSFTSQLLSRADDYSIQHDWRERRLLAEGIAQHPHSVLGLQRPNDGCYVWQTLYGSPEDSTCSYSLRSDGYDGYSCSSCSDRISEGQARFGSPY
jgi:hypothetical protein